MIILLRHIAGTPYFRVSVSESYLHRGYKGTISIAYHNQLISRANILGLAKKSRISRNYSVFRSPQSELR